MFIPDRFKRAVSVHIIKNLLPQDSVRAPLLLGIHGPSGEGKTYQTEQILNEMGVQAFLISGGQLESHKAGEPAQMLRNTYLSASDATEKGVCKAAVLLINDVDTGLGNWGDMVQYTINRQTVFGELMHLVDYPTLVDQRATYRIPIILTGNDFTALYGPLVRAGRMNAFEWIPTLEEKAEIVAPLFPQITVKDCEKLITELNKAAKLLQTRDSNDLPIAFYSHLKTSLVDEYIWKAIKNVGVNYIIDTILNGRRPKLTYDIQYEGLLEQGLTLIRSGQLLNHLRS